MTARELIVRRIDDRSEVSRIPIENPSQRKVEKVMMGMLRNMSDDFFIDDSAFDDLPPVTSLTVEG